MSTKAQASAIKSRWEVGLHQQEDLALGETEQPPAEAHARLWPSTAPPSGGKSKAELRREEQAETSGVFPWSARSSAWRGGRVGEEEGVPCTEQHPAPLRTFSHSSPGGCQAIAVGEKTTEDEGTWTWFWDNPAYARPGLSSAGLGTPRASPPDAGGGCEPAAAAAGSKRQSSTLQHAVMSFRSPCTCKHHGWRGAARTLHFLPPARLRLAGFLPEKVRLLLSSLFAT